VDEQRIRLSRCSFGCLLPSLPESNFWKNWRVCLLHEAYSKCGALYSSVSVQCLSHAWIVSKWLIASKYSHVVSRNSAILVLMIWIKIEWDSQKCEARMSRVCVVCCQKQIHWAHLMFKTLNDCCVQNNCYHLDDAKSDNEGLEFVRLKQAMETVGFSSDTQHR